MDTNAAYKAIQKYLENTPLMLIGSGNSCANGIPGMSELAQEIVRELDAKYSGDKAWDALKASICSGVDLETAMGRVSFSEELLCDVSICTWKFISYYDFLLFDKVIHKKVLIDLGELIKHLMATHPQKLNIITTNYDRVIEYSCDQHDVSINAFTQGRYLQTIDASVSPTTRCVNLLKIHGSLDWFERATGTLCCIPLQREIPLGMRPKIIAPGSEKYRAILRPPNRAILSAMDNLIHTSQSYLCIGYGFNDEQIQNNLIEEIGKGKPIVVVTKKLSDASHALIKTHAKKFAIIEEDDATCGTHIDTDQGELVVDDRLWTVSDFTIKILY